MPLLRHRVGQPLSELRAVDFSPEWASDSHRASNKVFRTGLIGQCANPGCRSGWLHLFRKRSTPILEEGWTCSPECTEARVQWALRRELDGCGIGLEMHRHRIPIGLVMLEQGWITRRQLREALESQREAGSGRLGEWLIRQRATDEVAITRALGLQWSCPVLAVESHNLAVLAGVVPRLFLDAFGALPLRIAAGRLLYLGFEQRLDPVLAFAIASMTGLRVESGIVRSSLFRPALARLLKEAFPTAQLAEAISETAAAHLMARSIERIQPVKSRILRVHDLMWLRMWLSNQTDSVPRTASICDVICSIGGSERSLDD
jgi:Type II secretion system (T2SS), protein E, N-terminal domain